MIRKKAIIGLFLGGKFGITDITAYISKEKNQLALPDNPPPAPHFT